MRRFCNPVFGLMIIVVDRLRGPMALISSRRLPMEEVVAQQLGPGLDAMLYANGHDLRNKCAYIPV